jgi:uncharacterized protein involved in tolerance to divalent cations
MLPGVEVTTENFAESLLNAKSSPYVVPEYLRICVHHDGSNTWMNEKVHEGPCNWDFCFTAAIIEQEISLRFDEKTPYFPVCLKKDEKVLSALLWKGRMNFTVGLYLTVRTTLGEKELKRAYIIKTIKKLN